jgi:hypothetical protein
VGPTSTFFPVLGEVGSCCQTSEPLRCSSRRGGQLPHVPRTGKSWRLRHRLTLSPGPADFSFLVCSTRPTTRKRSPSARASPELGRRPSKATPSPPELARQASSRPGCRSTPEPRPGRLKPPFWLFKCACSVSRLCQRPEPRPPHQCCHSPGGGGSVAVARPPPELRCSKLVQPVSLLVRALRCPALIRLRPVSVKVVTG